MLFKLLFYMEFHADEDALSAPLGRSWNILTLTAYHMKTAHLNAVNIEVLFNVEAILIYMTTNLLFYLPSKAIGDALIERA